MSRQQGEAIKLSEDIREKAKKISLLILDVDGVMTDGSITLDNNGNELKSFNVRDGHGIKMLQKEGTEIAIITGRYSEVVERRAKELGINHIYQRILNKLDAYNSLKEKLSINDENIAFIGDDVVDLSILLKVGLSIAVRDAHEYVKTQVMLITENKGGRGAVREITDLILYSKGALYKIIDAYSKI
ncbi:3-deoxy-D-manno-octulosonate 8-phosphate phosphatase [Candidatus Magnetoovum chiemensis]|nr:3-deoxy-D-manno-octulosonate 8-phosphate phosphatase [Candidatus Magnetoovum chiemensis]